MQRPRLPVVLELIYTIYLTSFFGMIWFGYKTSFATSFPQLSPFAVGLVATVALAVVYLCLKLSGGELRTWGDARPGRRLRIVLLSLPLIAVSACGVIAGAMLLYEGPVICREILADMSVAYARLEASAQSRLRVPDIEEIEARAAALRKRLAEEILNAEGGNLCGVGDKARLTLSELETLLTPNFHRPAAPPKPQHDCRKVDELRRLVAQYDGLINDAVANLPLRASTRQQEKAALWRSLKADAGDQSARLRAGLARLEGVADGEGVERLELPGDRRGDDGGGEQGLGSVQRNARASLVRTIAAQLVLGGVGAESGGEVLGVAVGAGRLRHNAVLEVWVDEAAGVGVARRGDLSHGGADLGRKHLRTVRRGGATGG